MTNDAGRINRWPPVINLKRKKFLPPLVFGKTILADDTIIGGAFVVGFGKKGEIGSIFIDTPQQRNGYGRQAMLSGISGFVYEKTILDNM